jgi:hypothetical protein
VAIKYNGVVTPPVFSTVSMITDIFVSQVNPLTAVIGSDNLVNALREIPRIGLGAMVANDRFGDAGLGVPNSAR